MSIRIAEFKKSASDRGAIIYESVSMTAYPPIFRDAIEAGIFLQWLDCTYGSRINVAANGAIDDAYHRWVRESQVLVQEWKKA